MNGGAAQTDRASTTKIVLMPIFLACNSMQKLGYVFVRGPKGVNQPTFIFTGKHKRSMRRSLKKPGRPTRLGGARMRFRTGRVSRARPPLKLRHEAHECERIVFESNLFETVNSCHHHLVHYLHRQNQYHDT